MTFTNPRLLDADVFVPVCGILGVVLSFYNGPIYLIYYFIPIILRDLYLRYIYMPYFDTMKDIPLKRVQWADKLWDQSYGPQLKYHLELDSGLIRVLMPFPFAIYAISVADPESLKEVLVAKGYIFIKPLSTRQFLSFIDGEGLITVEGETHRRQKKLLLPAFSHARIKTFLPIFFNSAQSLCGIFDGKIKENGGYLKTDVVDWLSRASLDSVSMAGFGYNFNALKDKNNKIAHLYHEVLMQNGARKGIQVLLAMNLLFGPIVLKIPIEIHRKAKLLRESVQDVGRQLVNKAIEADPKADKKERNVLAAIIEDARANGEDPRDYEYEMIQQCMTFLGAGHETTSTAVQWVLWYLGMEKHLHIQEKARQEILSVWKDRSVQPSFDEIESCKYLNSIVRETLRLIPPIPSTVRIASQDTSIGRFFVQKDTHIIFSPKVVNTHPKYWGSDAAEFIPERWDSLPVNFSNFNFLTFLHGPRSCIGSKFAQTQVKCMLFELLTRYNVTMEKEQEHVEFSSNVMTRPANEVLEIIFTPRKS